MNALRIWPPDDHPLYRIPGEMAPWRAEVEDAIVRYADEYGLAADPRARRRLVDSHHGELIARTYVHATPRRRDVLARWFTWLFFVDDYYDGPFGRQVHGHDDFLAETLAALPLGRDRPPPAARPLTRALQDTWTALAETTNLTWRIRFRHHIQLFVAMFRHESLNRVHGRIPPMRYFDEVRHPDSATIPCLDMLEYASDAEVPPLIYRTTRFRTLHETAVDVVCWANDVISMHQELSIGDVNNGVRIVEHHLGCTRQEAVDYAYARVARDVERFLRAEPELTRLCDEWPDLADADRAAVEECVAGLRRWMRGHLDWARNSARYPQERPASVDG